MRRILPVTVLSLLAISMAQTGSRAHAAPAWRPVPDLETGPGVAMYAGMTFDPIRERTLLLASETWEWDGRTWVRSSPIPAKRYQARVAWYDSARRRAMLLIPPTRRTYAFDGEAWVLESTGPTSMGRLETAVAYHAATDRAVLFAGFSGSVHDDTWIYDGSSWTSGPAAPAGLVARQRHALCDDPTRQRTVLFGGVDGTGNDLTDTWEWDGATWLPAPASPGAGGEIAMAFDASRSAVVVLAHTGDGPTLANEVWEYDGSWRAGTVLPAPFEPREDASMAYDAARNRLVLYGGEGRVSQATIDTWELDGTTWLRADAGDARPLERYLPVMAFDSGRDRVVVFGGDPFQDVWEYDGTRWAPGAPAPSALTPRGWPAFDYDSSRGRTVLFGGTEKPYGGVPHNDTWFYDGSSWTPGPSAPPALVPRGCHFMTYDSARSVMVMFGGADAINASLDDTWELGTAWSAGPPAPPGLEPRQYMAMAFDAARGRTVLWGGDSQGALFRDTWEYDGTAWTAGPDLPVSTDRCCVAMVFDPVRNVIMMTGGTALLDLSDTWLYDGAAWTPGDPLPAPRGALAMVWDTVRSRALVFGGSNDVKVERTLLEYCEGCAATAATVAAPGAGPANPPRVRVFATNGAPTTVDFPAYAASGWGTRAATGDVDGAAPDEILTGPGPGDVYGPHVRGFRSDGTAMGKINFFAYGTLKYGVNPAAASVDGDTPRELLTGAGPGAVFGPHVRGFNFDGATLTAIAKVNFFAYGTLKYGVNAGGGDVDGDGYAELGTGPGPGTIFSPQIRGFDVDGGAVSAIAKINFTAFPVAQYGATLVSGSVDADAFAELAAAIGPGPASSFPARAKGFDYDGIAIAALPGYDVTPFATLYGARIGLADLGAEAASELLVSPGPDPLAAADVFPYRYVDVALQPVEGRYLAFGNASYGATAAGGDVGP